MVRYYGVVYSKDGTMHLTKPHETQEQCLEVLKELIESKWADRVLRTTVIKRDVENDFIFGAPKSLNVVKNYD